MCISADWITAFASVGMVGIGWINYKLYRQSQEQAKQQRKDFEDLLEAIVISTVISGGGNVSSTTDMSHAIKAFTKNYKGERKIFQDKAT